MRILLIPGLWLDTSSWNGVLPAVRAAGHEPVALTLPGVGAPAAQSADVGIAQWVDAVVDEIDRSEGQVVLVGHSGGGNVAWGAADARPDRVARVVFVDTMPPPDGVGISEFPVIDGVVPFPGWEFFDEPDVADLDDSMRRSIEASAQTVPARVPTDALALRHPERHRIPVTVLSGALDAQGVVAALAEWGSWADEFAALDDVEVVHLASGHWPQFSQPEGFTQALVAAIR